MEVLRISSARLLNPDCAPIEALPSEILGKIVAYLPNSPCEENVFGAVEQAVRDKENLGRTSKRMYALVGDSYITALFIYAVLKRYKCFTIRLMVGDLRALEIGVWKYIRDYQLEKMYTFTQDIHFLAGSLVQRTNALYPIRHAPLKLAYEERYPFFCSFGQSIPAHFLLLADLNRVHIVTPFAEITIIPDLNDPFLALLTEEDHLNDPFLALFALIEALISHLDATFEGYASLNRQHSEIFDGPFFPETSANLSYFQIVHPLDYAEPVRKMSGTEFRVIEGVAIRDKMGTQDLILDPHELHFSVYKARKVFGQCLPKLNYGKSVKFSWNALHLVRSMIRARGRMPIWVRDRRAEVIKKHFWGRFSDDATIYMYDQDLAKEEVYTFLDEMIAEDKKGKSRQHILQTYGLPDCREGHPLLVIAHHIWQDREEAYDVICSMYENHMGTREILDHLMHQIGGSRFHLVAEYFWLGLYKRTLISMYERGMSTEGIQTLLDAMFEEYINGASREEVLLEVCPFLPETDLHPLANVAGLFCYDLEHSRFWDTNFIGEEKILFMYESGMDRKGIQQFFVDAMHGFNLKKIEIEFLVHEYGRGSKSFYEDFYHILDHIPSARESMERVEQIFVTHRFPYRLFLYLEHHLLWNMASNLQMVGIVPNGQKELIAMYASQTSKDQIEDFFTQIIHQSGVTNQRYLNALMGYSKLRQEDIEAMKNEISVAKARPCTLI